MGTRHIIAIKVDGEYKVAQYGQWDGYPEGQGVDVLTFLRDGMEREPFLAKVRQCRWATEEEMKATWNGFDIDMNPETNPMGLVSMDIANQHSKLFPQFSRDTGADILKLIYSSDNGLALDNDIEFCTASLHCEWAYVADFDANTFEVFKGFNHEPVPAGERFADMTPEPKGDYQGAEQYYPVKLLKSYQLDQLPDAESFLREMEELTKTDEDED